MQSQNEKKQLKEEIKKMQARCKFLEEQGKLTSSPRKKTKFTISDDDQIIELCRIEIEERQGQKQKEIEERQRQKQKEIEERQRQKEIEERQRQKQKEIEERQRQKQRQKEINTPSPSSPRSPNNDSKLSNLTAFQLLDKWIEYFDAKQAYENVNDTRMAKIMAERMDEIIAQTKKIGGSTRKNKKVLKASTKVKTKKAVRPANKTTR